MTDIFEKIHNGDPVNMTSPDYRPVADELERADRALYDLNHTKRHTEEQAAAWNALFEGNAPQDVGYFTPLQIDFPKNVHFGKGDFFNHHLTMMSIAGITLGDNVQLGPNVTMVTDNHDLHNHLILRCKPITLEDNVWVGANVTILPGVTIGNNAIIGAASVVTKDIPANSIVVGNPARVIKHLD